MKAVIQRVSSAQVRVDDCVVSEIGPGLVTLLGIESGDTPAQAEKLMRKIVELRVFADPAGKMNLSLKEVSGSHLLISQFTLAADCGSGKRPSFTQAEKPDAAKALYEKALVLSADLGVKTWAGVFQADMKVALVNDGPVTFILEA